MREIGTFWKNFILTVGIIFFLGLLIGFMVFPNSSEPQKEDRAGSGKMAIKALVGNIIPPKLIKKIDPIYPEEARKDGIEGIVSLESTTDIYGRVIDVKVLRSVDTRLDQAAIEAARQCVFEPSIILGKPRGFVVKMNVRFRSKEIKYSFRAFLDRRPS